MSKHTVKEYFNKYSQFCKLNDIKVEMEAINGMAAKINQDGYVEIDTTNYVGGNCNVNILALTAAGGTAF